jgi:hypothetical protein
MRESMKREIAFGPYEQGIASASKNVLSSLSDTTGLADDFFRERQPPNASRAA